MVDTVKPGARLFFDTGYFLALALPRDAWNIAARKWAKRSKQHKYKLVTMTDCASFVTMGEFGLTHALSADHHFEQAGFVALLKV